MTQVKIPRRPVHGILLLDKPEGLSSNRILCQIKRLYQAQKAGHTGTLDPIATGMLPICFGEATKFASMALLEADKFYQTHVVLGQETETGDREGEVTVEQPIPVLAHEKLEAVLAHFRGDIEQIPPMYSALKKDGQPLYKLARAGVTVERKPRQVKIFALHLLKMDAVSLDLEIHCSKGTYVRSLVQDIGRALGCGAHVGELRRTAVASLLSSQMHTPNDLSVTFEQDGVDGLDALLLPADGLLRDVPSIQLAQAQVDELYLGRNVVLSDAGHAEIEQLRLYGPAGFIGVGCVEAENMLKPKRLFAA